MLVTYLHAYNQNYIPLYFLRVNRSVVCAIPIHQIRTRPTVSRFEFCIKVWRRRWEKTNSEDKLGFGHHHHSNIVFRNRPSHVFALLFKAFLFYVAMGTIFVLLFFPNIFAIRSYSKQHLIQSDDAHRHPGQRSTFLSYPYRQTHLSTNPRTRIRNELRDRRRRRL